jgi:hypothetical protein
LHTPESGAQVGRRLSTRPSSTCHSDVTLEVLPFTRFGCAPLHRLQLSFLLPLYLGFGQLYELASNNPWRWHVEKTRLPRPERCFHAMLTSIPTHDLVPMPPSAPSKQTKRSRPFTKTFHRHLSAVSGGINCAARGNGGIAPAVAPTSISISAFSWQLN